MSKICVICQNNFEATGNKKMCSPCGVRECLTCQKTFSVTFKEFKKQFCSVKCAQNSTSTRDKIKETNEKLYGGTGFAGKQGIPWFNMTEEEKETSRKKQAATNMSRYGYENVLSSPEIREKLSKTNKERYGAENVFSGDSSLRENIDNKRDYTNLSEVMKDRWNTMDVDEQEKIVSDLQKGYKNFVSTISPERRLEVSKRQSEARKSFFANETSSERKERQERHSVALQKAWNNYSDEEKDSIIQQRNVSAAKSKKNYRAISKLNRKWHNYLLEETGINFEYEFNVGKYNYDLRYGNLVIDINPTASHNSNISFAHLTGLCDSKEPECQKHKFKDKNYHLNRAETLQAAGYDWLFVFEHNSREKVVSLVKAKLGLNKRIGARKCKVEEIDSKVAKDFINEIHLLGMNRKMTVNLALTLDGEILGVMSFRTKESHSDWELYRLVFKNDVMVIGGAKKLWNHFISKYSPTTVMTYADYNIGAGKVYESFGMVLKKKPRPVKFWSNIKTGEYINNNSLLIGADRVVASWAKKSGKDYFIVGRDEQDFVDRGGLSVYGTFPNNEQIAEHYGFVKVYDCGYQEFLWRNYNVK